MNSVAWPSIGTAVPIKNLLLAGYSIAAACHLFSVFSIFLDACFFSGETFQRNDSNLFLLLVDPISW
jgi:hypothetical protein